MQRNELQNLIVEIETPENQNSERFYRAMNLIFSEEDLREFFKDGIQETKKRQLGEKSYALESFEPSYRIYIVPRIAQSGGASEYRAMRKTIVPNRIIKKCSSLVISSYF